MSHQQDIFLLLGSVHYLSKLWNEKLCSQDFLPFKGHVVAYLGRELSHLYTIYVQYSCLLMPLDKLTIGCCCFLKNGSASPHLDNLELKVVSCWAH